MTIMTELRKSKYSVFDIKKICCSKYSCFHLFPLKCYYEMCCIPENALCSVWGGWVGEGWALVSKHKDTAGYIVQVHL